MPNWKKIIVSGSNAALNSLSITSTLNVTGSTFLSASSGIALQLYGSGSTIFSISGSSSEIFRISDDGSSSNLFSVSSGSTTILSIDSSKVVSISGSLVVTGSITGSLFGTASWATNALTASYAATSSKIQSSNNGIAVNGQLFLTPGNSMPQPGVAYTPSYMLGITYNYSTNTITTTASWANNSLTASYLNPGTYTITSSWATNALTASYGNITGSLFGTASWALYAVTASYVTSSNVYGPNGANSILTASFSLTASYVNTLNQNVLITGSLTVGSTTAGASENTLTLGPRDNGSEGGQIMLQAPGGTYTSASMWDNYANRTRLLRGTNAGSDAEVASFNMHTKQMQLPAYNALNAFSGTPVAALGVNSSGDIITIQTGSGAGGGGGSTFVGGTNDNNRIITATGTTPELNGEANLTFNGSQLSVTGTVTASGAIVSTANNAMYFRGGDDAEFWDINVANTVGIYGQQSSSVAGLKLGSSGPTLFGSASKFGIGTITPTQATLEVNGNVYATSFTGSLFGTSSWATNALTASYISTLRATGSNTEIQFNNNGNLGSTSNFTFNNNILNIIGTSIDIIRFSSLGSDGAYLGSNINSANENGLFSGNGDQVIATIDVANNLYRYSNNAYIYDDNNHVHQLTGSLSIDGYIIRPLYITASGYNQLMTIESELLDRFITMIGSGSRTISLSQELSNPGDIGLFTGTDYPIATWVYDKDEFYYSAGNYYYSASRHVFINPIDATNGITGSLFGTASWARNVLTASYLNPGTYTITSSWAQNVLTASFITASNVYGPYGSNSILSSSYSITSSFTVTASVANSIKVNGVGNKPTYIYMATDPSIINNTGSYSTPAIDSSLYYNPANKTLYLSSLYVTSSIIASSVSSSLTGSLLGSASYANISLTASYVTGSIFTSTNPALSASYALTASYALNGGGSATPGGPLNSIQFNRVSQFTGSSKLTYDEPNNTITFAGTFIDTFTSASVDIGNRYLQNDDGDVTVRWNNGMLYSVPIPGQLTASVDWTNRVLYYTDGTTPVMDWSDLQLIDENNITKVWWRSNRNVIYDSNASSSIAWGARVLKNTSGLDVLDWGNYIMYDANGSSSFEWSVNNRNLYDVDSQKSIDYNARALHNDDGTKVNVNWGDTINGSYTAATLYYNNTASLDWKNKNLIDNKGNTALSYIDTGSANGVRLYGTSSYALTASLSVTASYVPTIKSGKVLVWGGTGTAPRTGSVTFTTPYVDDSYAVTVTGGTGIARSWTIDTKTSTGFIVNSNDKTTITGDVYWIAVPYNS